MSDEVLTKEQLIISAKHDTFHNEVITGKAGGLSTGADIDYATNQVTGQVQKTLPKVLRDLGMMVQTWTATTGGTLTDASQVFLNDITASTGKGNYYAWTGAFPKVVAPGTDPAEQGYIVRNDAKLRNDLANTESSVLISGVEARVVAGLRNDLANTGSSVLISGTEARVIAEAANNVRAVTIITGAGTQDVTASQIGSSLLFATATTIRMPTIASLGGVTGHYRIMAGSNPITLTRIDGTTFTVRGGSVPSVTIPAGSDCYVAYGASGVYVYGLATYETIVKSYCLVNALGTGAPNELVSAALPENLAINSRYVLTNPFGVNVPVICWAEILYSGKWSDTRFLYNSTTGESHGVAANYMQGVGIIIQTAITGLLGSCTRSGGGHGVPSPGVVTSAPCRVFIQKLGA